MARQRRGGGFKASELPLRGTLGTLLRTAAAQVGPLREALGDALERTAREGRSRLDDVRARYADGRSSGGDRRRADALAELGEIVLELIRRGEIDLAELPEVRDLVAYLDEVDGALDDSDLTDHIRSDLRDRSSYGPGHDDDDDASPSRPPARNRFDSRGRDSSRTMRSAADDGTTSSRTWTPPKRPAAAKPAPRVWRPPVDDDADAPPAAVAKPPATRKHPLPSRAGANKKGGISFEDDDSDLADYMHPDDVPAKKPDDGES